MRKGCEGRERERRRKKTTGERVGMKEKKGRGMHYGGREVREKVGRQ